MKNNRANDSKFYKPQFEKDSNIELFDGMIEALKEARQCYINLMSDGTPTSPNLTFEYDDGHSPSDDSSGDNPAAENYVHSMPKIYPNN